jgi:NAD(P)-dependent dehydrogenase (short-subunit alcohol dehydrogenase family)
MSSALILGASRGIGLEFTRQYRAAGWTVFATCRSEEDRIRLRDLGAQTLKLDVTKVEDLAAMTWQIEGERLDVAVINAGVFGPRNSSLQKTPTEEQFDLVMRTNVLAAMRVAPLLASCLGPRRGTLAFVSSRMGSIGEANGSYGMLYRVSKAAVNMVAKLAHTDFAAAGMRTIALHPGWVRTDMGGPNAEIDVSQSIDGMRKVIADPVACPGGGFYDYRGQPLTW